MKIVVANCFTHEEFMCWARQTIVGRWSPEGTEKVKSTFRLKANDR